MWEFKKSFFAFIILFVFSINHIGQSKIPNSFIPPLKVTPYVSGTFGELRSNHFHSGLDLSTRGRMGYPVYAIEDGYVSRINVSPVGYGKALYVDHNNGYTSVYGHMNEYSKPIDLLVVKRQYQIEAYSFDFNLPKNLVQVKKGDVIGYTGNSGGSGGPHLHFEVRETSTEKPMNPLLFYSNIKDDVAPSIRRVRVYPLDKKTIINGTGEPNTYTVAYSSGSYTLALGNTISAIGEIGLGIDVIDYVTGSTSRCGVYTIQLFVNNQKIFESEVDKFSFNHSRFINAHIDYPYKYHSNIYVQKSYLEPNNKLEIYNSVKNEGVINVEQDSVYNILYVAKDINGNTSKLTFRIKGVVLPSVESEQQEVVTWNEPFKILNENYRVSIDKNSFYYDVPFDVTVVPRKNGRISDSYIIGDPSIPLQKNVDIAIRIPDSINISNRYLTLALLNKKGKLIHAGGTVINGWLNLKTRDLGTYSIYTDSVPPVIQLKNNNNTNDFTSEKRLVIKVIDDFSGINNYRCEIDGKWELFEYDLKTNRLICPLPKTNIKKGQQHQLIVNAKDGCGNAASKSFTFIY